MLGAGKKTAPLINALVPASKFDDGFVYVRTTNNVPLYGMELFFTPDVKVLANVAAGSIDPSITFTPPAPVGSMSSICSRVGINSMELRKQST